MYFRISYNGRINLWISRLCTELWKPIVWVRNICTTGWRELAKIWSNWRRRRPQKVGVWNGIGKTMVLFAFLFQKMPCSYSLIRSGRMAGETYVLQKFSIIQVRRHVFLRFSTSTIRNRWYNWRIIRTTF